MSQGRRNAIALGIAALVAVIIIALVWFGPKFVKTPQGEQQATTTETETPPMAASEPLEQGGPTEEEIAAVPEGIHPIPADDARYDNDKTAWEEFCSHCTAYGGTPYTAAEWNAKGISPQLRDGQFKCIWE